MKTLPGRTRGLAGRGDESKELAETFHTFLMRLEPDYAPPRRRFPRCSPARNEIPAEILLDASGVRR